MAASQNCHALSTSLNRTSRWLAAASTWLAETHARRLVYRHQKHLISLTEMPAGSRSDLATTPRTINGYNVVHWTENGVSYWAVSDLAASKLEDFAQLIPHRPRGIVKGGTRRKSTLQLPGRRQYWNEQLRRAGRVSVMAQVQCIPQAGQRWNWLHELLAKRCRNEI